MIFRRGCVRLILGEISKKTSGGDEYIELAFISPKIGESYREVLDDLQDWILWELRIKPTPNTAAMTEETRRTLPTGYTISKSPGFNVVEKTITVKTMPPMEKSVMETWEKVVLDRTGYRLQGC